MELNLSARYTLDTIEDGKIILCFKHAVQAAIKGEDVELEVDDFDAPGDVRSTHCRACYKERHNIE